MLFDFFSNVRRNPTMLQRLEKDLLWKDIDDLLSEAAGYDSFRYDEAASSARPMAFASPARPARHAGSRLNQLANAVAAQ